MKPELNHWTVSISFFAILGILISILLFYKQVSKPLKYISIITLLFSVTLLDWILIWSRYQYYFPWFIGLSFTFNWLYGPIFYFAIKAFSPAEKLEAMQKQIHLLPFICMLVIYTPLWLQDTEVKQKIIMTGKIEWSFYKTIFSYLPWMAIIHMTFYLIISAIAIKKTYAFRAIRDWGRFLVIAFGIFVFNFWFYNVLKLTSWFSIYWDYGIAFSMILVILLTIVMTYMHTSIFEGNTILQSIVDIKAENFLSNRMPEAIQQNGAHEKGHEVKYKTSNLPSPVSFKISQKIDSLVKEKKMYKDFNLRLDSLSGELGLNRNQVSQAINEHFGKNFFEYINSLRIQEAKKLLLDPSLQTTSIKEITYMAGFNNKVSFYKCFKNDTGMSPVDYRNHYLQQTEFESNEQV